MLDELLIVPTVITSVHSVRIACEHDRRQDRKRRAEALDDAGPNSEEMRGGLSSPNSPADKLSPPFPPDSRSHHRASIFGYSIYALIYPPIPDEGYDFLKN